MKRYSFHTIYLYAIALYIYSDISLSIFFFYTSRETAGWFFVIFLSIVFFAIFFFSQLFLVLTDSCQGNSWFWMISGPVSQSSKLKKKWFNFELRSVMVVVQNSLISEPAKFPWIMSWLWELPYSVRLLPLTYLLGIGGVNNETMTVTIATAGAKIIEKWR